MNVEFTEGHLETLCELKALAEKHNCSIRFGFYNSICDGTKQGTLTELWFELFDPNNAKRHYHSLRYSERLQVVEYKYVSFSETKIKGFEKQEHSNVCREAMALKVFGDLVCDYLGEERIVRVY